MLTRERKLVVAEALGRGVWLAGGAGRTWTKRASPCTVICIRSPGSTPGGTRTLTVRYTVCGCGTATGYRTSKICPLVTPTGTCAADPRGQPFCT